MKHWSLLLLRVTLGALLVWWGLDKLVSVEHGVEVAQHFYFGVGTNRLFLHAFGVLETALGVLIMLGWGRRWTHPLLLLIAAVTLVGVWRSVVDPWGWFLEGANVLFYPSVIIFAGALVLWAFRDTDVLALDAAKGFGHDAKAGFERRS
jgi:putative oxidoreductase